MTVGITRKIGAVKIPADVSVHAEHLRLRNRPGSTGILIRSGARETAVCAPWWRAAGARPPPSDRRPLLAGICLGPNNPNEGFVEALEHFHLLHISDTFHYDLHLPPEHFHHFLAHFLPNIFMSKHEK